MSVPVRHSLPRFRTVPRFGSLKNGSCKLVMNGTYRGSICNGTSVLTDGIIPALRIDSSSLWASQLLTMEQSRTERIVLSFELENQVYDCVELAVVNCPQRNWNASMINIYSDTSFRPERESESLGILEANYVLSNTSCDYLVKFYVSFMPVNTSYFNIEFPVHTSNNYVFVGEISFFNADGILNSNSTHIDQSTSSTTTQQESQSTKTAAITVSMLIIILTSTLVVLAVLKALWYLRKYKRKQETTISNICNIQCQNNSAYQETKFEHKYEDKDIKCLENSAYSNVKHGADQTSEYLDSHECTKQQYRADNSQHLVSERNDYEEITCVVFNIDSQTETVYI